MVTRLGAVALASSLSGCIGTAVGLLQPVGSSAYEASMTPESVGITTSTWRGKSCKDLELSEASMGQQQQDAAAKGDSGLVKITGWHMDSIRQVRTEQGCVAGATEATVPASGQVTAYGYCTTTTDESVYVTPMFTYGDFYADGGAAESQAFTEMLRSTYNFKGNAGYCLMEDSPAKAQAAIERAANITTMIIGWNTVRVPWTPPPIAKKPKASVATATTVSPAKANVATVVSQQSVNAQDLGLTLETPSPELVQALGLKDRSGAWVVSVAPGSAAAKAGIKAMDVIRDVSGQVVNAPSDVQAIAGKLRAGYKASVGIWRDRASRDVSLVIPAGASAPVAKAPGVAVAPGAAAVVAPPAAAAGKLYCHAYVFVVDQPGGFQSPILERAGERRDPSVMMASLSSFVAKVRQQQPEQWRPFTFPLDQCSSPTGYCFANAESSLLKAKQSAAQFCFLTRAEAETDLQKFNSFTPVYQIVE